MSSIESRLITHGQHMAYNLLMNDGWREVGNNCLLAPFGQHSSAATEAFCLLARDLNISRKDSEE